MELTTKHLYIQHGRAGAAEQVKAAVQDAISSSLLEAKPEDKWIQMVNTAHTQVGLRSTRHARPAAATAPPRGAVARGGGTAGRFSGAVD